MGRYWEDAERKKCPLSVKNNLKAKCRSLRNKEKSQLVAEHLNMMDQHVEDVREQLFKEQVQWRMPVFQQDPTDLNSNFFGDHQIFTVEPGNAASYQFAVNPMVLDLDHVSERKRIETGDGIFEGGNLVLNVSDENIRKSFGTESAFQRMCWYEDSPFYEYGPVGTTKFLHDKILYHFEHKVCKIPGFHPTGEKDQRHGLLVYTAHERYICALTYGEKTELRIMQMTDLHKMKRFFDNLSNLKSATDANSLSFLEELTLIVEIPNLGKNWNMNISMLFEEREINTWPVNEEDDDTDIDRFFKKWRWHRDLHSREDREERYKQKLPFDKVAWWEVSPELLRVKKWQHHDYGRLQISESKLLDDDDEGCYPPYYYDYYDDDYDLSPKVRWRRLANEEREKHLQIEYLKMTSQHTPKEELILEELQEQLSEYSSWFYYWDEIWGDHFKPAAPRGVEDCDENYSLSGLLPYCDLNLENQLDQRAANPHFFQDHQMFTIKRPDDFPWMDIPFLVKQTIGEFLPSKPYEFAVHPVSLELDTVIDRIRIEAGDGIFKNEGLLLIRRTPIFECFKEARAFEQMAWFDDSPFYEFYQLSSWRYRNHTAVKFLHDKVLYQFEHKVIKTKDRDEQRYGLLVYSVHEKYICALAYGDHVQLRVMPITDFHKMKRLFLNLRILKSATNPDVDYLSFLEELTLVMEIPQLPHDASLNVSPLFQLNTQLCCDEGFEQYIMRYNERGPNAAYRIRCWEEAKDQARYRKCKWVENSLKLSEHMYLVKVFYRLKIFKRSSGLWKRHVEDSNSNELNPWKQSIEVLRSYLMRRDVQLAISPPDDTPSIDDTENGLPPFFSEYGGNAKILEILDRFAKWLPEAEDTATRRGESRRMIELQGDRAILVDMHREYTCKSKEARSIWRKVVKESNTTSLDPKKQSVEVLRNFMTQLPDTLKSWSCFHNLHVKLKTKA